MGGGPVTYYPIVTEQSVTEPRLKWVNKKGITKL
jgi:hypothetical protein